MTYPNYEADAERAAHVKRQRLRHTITLARKQVAALQDSMDILEAEGYLPWRPYAVRYEQTKAMLDAAQDALAAETP